MQQGMISLLRRTLRLHVKVKDLLAHQQVGVTYHVQNNSPPMLDIERQPRCRIDTDIVLIFIPIWSVLLLFVLIHKNTPIL